MAEPIAYIARTRAYYAALGYPKPYRWAVVDVVPFSPLRRRLAEARLAIVTTAAPHRPGAGEQGPGAPYNAAAKFYDVYSAATDPMPDLRISHVAIDRDHTSAEDIGTWFPLAALKRAAEMGKVGEVSPRFHGFPTNRSQRRTTEIDCPELVQRCLDDQIDAALLVPNCPVCHQSLALAANALEARGIATVILGCALDIIEHVGAPRFLFSDMPLGNGAGRPHDPASQDETLALALGLLETAKTPRSTRHSPLTWPGPASWREDYANPDRLTREEIDARRAAFDEGRDIARRLRQ